MRASSSTTTIRSGRVLAGVFICNSTFVTTAILPGENPCQAGKPTLCYIYFGLCVRFRDVEHGASKASASAARAAHCRALRNLVSRTYSMIRLPSIVAFATVGLAAISMVHAQPAPPSMTPLQDVLTLAASASVEVAYDVMAITLSTTREGSDAAAVQSQLRQAIDAALTEARRAQRPGQLDVRTGAFSLSPRYGSKSPTITGWVGHGELVLEGRDMSAIAQLAGRLNTMTVARTGYALARETRERVEADAATQAIAKFRAR